MTRYPKVRRDETVVDDYHGTLIADPYRWLEDPDSEETQTFVKEQNEVTQAFLSKCTTRKKFEERMTEMYDYPKYGCPFRYGNQVFYFYNSGLQAQSVLYAQVMIKPNVLVPLIPAIEQFAIFLAISARFRVRATCVAGPKPVERRRYSFAVEL